MCSEPSSDAPEVCPAQLVPIRRRRCSGRISLCALEVVMAKGAPKHPEVAHAEHGSQERQYIGKPGISFRSEQHSVIRTVTPFKGMFAAVD